MNFDQLKQVYFIGVGGIGMSALARFFVRQGLPVFGYDKTPTRLTRELEDEGIKIHFEEDVALVESMNLTPSNTLIVYTPAIPPKHRELEFFRSNGFQVEKRAAVLGLISRQWKAVCVAGTHGKTTISTMVAHLFKCSKVDCSAFLGGISNNYETNYLHSDTSDYVVLEADEFDRSFLELTPHLASISSMDADHLDIYGDQSEIHKSFRAFANLVKTGGTLIMKAGLPSFGLPDGVKVLRYGVEEAADYVAKELVLKDGVYFFSLKIPQGFISNLELGVPGLVNVENAVAASALALMAGVSEEELRQGLKSFRGIRRRFEYRIRTSQFIFIDDYAHHPTEIEATISSVKAMFPGKKLMGVFQPHLFSRTKDFAQDFARALDALDEVILLDIYPAREEPLPGITSETILGLMKHSRAKLLQKEDLAGYIGRHLPDILLTMGAGDIDKQVPVIEEQIKKELRS
jgi:UDP-N-acetylmuramate--alanine ligase